MSNMPEYESTINLIPYGLPQFLDFEAPTEQLRKIQQVFVEVPADDGSNNFILHELMEDEENELRFYRETRPVTEEKDGETVTREKSVKVLYEGEEDDYTVNAEKHLQPWLNKWLPVPFLRESGDTHPDGLPRFRPGPTNWARAYLTRVPSDDDPEILNWRLVLAFDMQVEEARKDRHVALSPDDVTARAKCSLADQVRDNSWFLREGWVDAWLHSVWDEWFQDKANKRAMPRKGNGEDPHLGYLASYIVYLHLIQKIIDNKSVRILNLASTQEEAASNGAADTIAVDLILDIGNSRTTGILVENIPGKRTDLNDSYLLELRDLGHPEKFYTDPFETRVEFSKADFGSAAFSKRSGRRSNAFAWASPVRTGYEATRLANLSSNSGGTSGMTSPKRYLWDQENSGHLWYFNRANQMEREELVSSNSICRYVNNSGTPIACVRELNPVGENPGPKSYLTKLFKATLEDCKNQDSLPANQPRFSRSSMMMFLFMELVQQALVTINSPARRYSRKFHDRPRRLRSIIFTVPGGMAFAEQRIYRSWVYAAVNVLWNALGWSNFFTEPKSGRAKRLSAQSATNDFRSNPEIRCRWDEATCTQLVYLYNEINRNFQGDAHLFFEIMGRMREVPKENTPAQKEWKPTLRVATIDMGGGTTDLSITTYVLANDKSSTNRILPKQEIRDGINFGGDNILRLMIKDLVTKSVINYLKKKGVSQSLADDLMKEIFGNKISQVSVQNQRLQFLRLVAMPIAYQILNRYEQYSLKDLTSEIAINPRDVLPVNDETHPEYGMVTEAIKFFNETVTNRTGVPFDFLDVEFSFPTAEVDKIITQNSSQILNNMGEVINAYDCDLLLLSGKPSCWNAVVRQIFAMLPVAPDRVVPMSQYHVGPWYPFASSQGKITDPKTTVVTGAILCTLAENSIEGFVFDSSRLELKSTARFIGQLDDKVLPREMVWFPNKNPDKKKGEDEYTKVIEFSSPITIGFRQLEVPRWTISRGWKMDFANDEARQQSIGHTPYEVRVKFEMPGLEDEIDNVPAAEKDIQAKLDQPVIPNEADSVQERKFNGGNVELEPVSGRPVRITLCTIDEGEEAGCWMDTGVLYK